MLGPRIKMLSQEDAVVPAMHVSKVYQQLAPQWRQFVFVHAVQRTAAALIELLLLLDRKLFLLEEETRNDSTTERNCHIGSSTGTATCSVNFAAELLPLFDPGLSPRNTALVGMVAPKAPVNAARTSQT